MNSLPRVKPASGTQTAVWQIWATMRTEMMMQWRRKGLWITFACFGGLLVLFTVQTAFYLSHLPPASLYAREHFTAEELNNVMTYGSTAYGVMFFGLLAALLVVDRMERDRRLGVTELQHAAPQGFARYVVGKYVGNTLALLGPALAIYLLCALVALLMGWPAVILPKVLLAFLLVLVPSSLAALGMTLLLVSFLSVRVVQIGFSLLWVYLSIGIGWHGLAETVFNTSGILVYPEFFPTRLPTIAGTPSPSLSLALTNIAVLLLTAVVALCLTCGSLAFQRHRKEVA